MSPPTPESHLLSILASHQTSLGPSQTLWAFTAPKTADPVTDYIEKFLTPSTLLTFSEASITAQLRKTGTLQKLQREIPRPSASSLGAFIPPTPPLTSEALERLTESTNDAVDRVMRHATALREQKAILDDLRARSRGDRERKRKMDKDRARQWAGEKEDMIAVVEEVVQIVREEAADLRGSVEQAGDEEEVRIVLEKDDRALRRLEEINERLVMPVEGGEEEGGKEKEVGRFAALLAELEAEEVRARLERVYWEAVGEGDAMEVDDEDGMGTGELEAEVEGLKCEVEGVCEQAVEEEFVKPVMAEVEMERKNRGENWKMGGDFISQTIKILANRNFAMADRLQINQARDTAALTILESVETELAAFNKTASGAPIIDDAATPPGSPSKSATLSTPPPGSKHRLSIGRLSPNKRFVPPLGGTGHRRRNSDSPLLKNAHPDQALLSLLGITLPAGPHVAQLSHRLNTQNWDVSAWEEVEAEAWRAKMKGDFRLRGDGGRRWPVSMREAKEAGGALVAVDEEMRGKLADVEKQIQVVALGLKKVNKEVEVLDDRLKEQGKQQFTDRWAR